MAEVRAENLDPSDPDWVVGPLPIRQGTNQTTLRRGNMPSTDAAARRTLVATQQADTLYGGAGLHRSHRVTAAATGRMAAVLAVELLVGPREDPGGGSTPGLVAVHLAVPNPEDDPAGDALVRHLAMLASCVHPGVEPAHEVWGHAQELLPAGVRIVPGSRVRTLGFHALTAPDGAGVRQESLVAAYWMVTATAPDQRPDMASRALRHELTLERVDWSALVLRDGAAFVAHQCGEEPFAHVLRTLVHSVHLDALLLALVQRRLVDRSGNDAVRASLEVPDQLVVLERQHFDFKRSYWRTSLTDKRTSPSDDVLRAFQGELLTTLDVADVEERVQDGARLARTLHAERQDRAQQELARVVQNASVVIGALGLSFTAVPVIAEPGWRVFAVATAVGLVAMLAAFLVLFLTGRRAGRH